MRHGVVLGCLTLLLFSTSAGAQSVDAGATAPAEAIAPKLKSHVEAVYPEEALRERREGTVGRARSRASEPRP